MARIKVPITVIDPANGNAIAGASVRVQTRASGTDATLYQAETGATTIGNPMTTDSAGRVSGWVGRGAFNAIISGTGITTYTQAFEGAPAADGSGETSWLATPDWVTSLPSSPINGQEINFLADATAGVVWRLKYRASSSSAFKWEFTGGAALQAVAAGTGALTAANGYGGLSANNVQVALPLNGDYELDWKCYGQNDTAGVIIQAGVYAPTPDIDATTFAANYAALTTAGVVNTGYALSGIMTATGINGTRIVEMRFLTGSGTATFGRKVLRCRPVRVG